MKESLFYVKKAKTDRRSNKQIYQGMELFLTGPIFVTGALGLQSFPLKMDRTAEERMEETLSLLFARVLVTKSNREQKEGKGQLRMPKT